MAETMSVDKKEIDREGSEDSMDSTPEAETEAPQENVATQQKRKGGRKPVRLGRVIPPRLMSLIWNLDICYFRGTETTKPSSAGSV
jgi:hypothetical protein